MYLAFLKIGLCLLANSTSMDSRQRKRVRDAELEEVNNESQVSPWYSRYMGNDNVGGQGTYNVVCDPHAAALRVAIGSSVAAQQVTKSPRRMDCVTPVCLTPCLYRFIVFTNLIRPKLL